MFYLWLICLIHEIIFIKQWGWSCIQFVSKCCWQAINLWNSKAESTWIFSPSTDSDDFVFMGTTMSLRLKEKLKTNWLLITRISLSLISKAWCTLIESSATSVVARLMRVSSAVNESLSCKYRRIFRPSEWSYVIRACALSLCWSLVWCFVPVKSCIALFTSAVTDIERSHSACCLSLMPCPLVKAPKCFQSAHKDLLHHKIWPKNNHFYL